MVLLEQRRIDALLEIALEHLLAARASDDARFAPRAVDEHREATDRGLRRQRDLEPALALARPPVLWNVMWSSVCASGPSIVMSAFKAVNASSLPSVGVSDSGATASFACW